MILQFYPHFRILSKNLVGGLEHEFYFSHSVGNFIIPTDSNSMIFQRGRRTNHQLGKLPMFAGVKPYNLPQDSHPFHGDQQFQEKGPILGDSGAYLHPPMVLADV